MKNHRVLKIIASQSGFTLIEVLIALAIFTIGILSVNAMQIASIRGNFNANNITESTSWASDRIESLLSLAYTDDVLDDDDGDGTDQDADINGEDDNGGNFGLDDAGADADHTETSPDGRYTIEWNIAVDHPFPGIKTIKVNIARDEQGLTKRVPMTYMKADSV
ncbi:MAG: prepilin-type N-terminal cleavage/methylation domain-containing protein [Desulfurivibrio sp.]|jgi:prepilin-type N-terminal cleavage/methylation domain-containing protein|nr:MAG: prepilin-type N-terminal cleavage/methylation domain-containing protein [Desulfurivibrio sp.]